MYAIYIYKELYLLSHFAIACVPFVYCMVLIAVSQKIKQPTKAIRRPQKCHTPCVLFVVQQKQQQRTSCKLD